MIKPSLNEFKKLRAKGNVIPVFKEILADLETPVSTFLKLTENQEYAYLLESVEGGERWGRYSFIAWAPKKIFKSIDTKFCIFNPSSEEIWEETDNPILSLKKEMSRFKPVNIDGLPRFWGGAVGYISYDMVRFFENLPDKPKEVLHVPDSIFMLTDKLVVFDHLKHTVKIIICVNAEDKSNLDKLYKQALVEIENTVSLLKKPLTLASSIKYKSYKEKSNVSEKQYSDKIEKTKEYIRAGDIVQAVISQKFSRPTKVSSFDIYRSLRQINPSPYMYFFKFSDFEIVGSSPEILVRKEDSLAETRPIAGSMPRGKTIAEESQFEKDLLADPKERAEHIMLVDLGRNDLARVCKPATVTVPELMVIEKYSHIMHIVSSVKGILPNNMDAYELLMACFPAGTVSGAPKVRAMEIIDELETDARGPYAGAVGYFSYAGDMDMAITIRTIVVKNNIAYGQAGAGIVADSIPAKEYQESKNKIAALFKAIDKAEEGI